jgi:hypothetical protein
MRRILLPLCLLVAATAVDAHAQAAPGPIRVVRGDGKVTAPVEIEVVPQADPGPGMRRVRIVARPTVDAASLAIDVAAEAGLSLADPAEAAWTAPARLGEEVVRDVDLAVSGPGELRLVITATVKHEGGMSQTGLHTFAFNPAPEDGAAKRGLRIPTDPGGRVIVEVRAGRP